MVDRRDLTLEEMGVLLALRAVRAWPWAMLDQIQQWAPYHARRSASGGEMPFGQQRLKTRLARLEELGLVERNGRYREWRLTEMGQRLSADEVVRRRV